jgi:hypothetical protein
MTQPVFKVFTGAMQPYTKDINGVARKFIKTTASSSVKDRHGDEIDAAAVQKMAASAKSSEMTIFLNHSYDVPEDIFGTTKDAVAIQRGVDGDGAPIWDLDLDVALNESNDRAIKTWQALDQEVRLGVSIGALILDYEPMDQKAGPFGPMRIKDVDLLEASIVGIPANPRSWVQGAAKAIKSFHKAQEEGTLQTLELISGAIGETETKTLIVKEEKKEEKEEGKEDKPLDPENDDSLADDEIAKTISASTEVEEDESQPDATEEQETEKSVESDPEAPADGATQSASSEDSVTLSVDSAVAGIDLLVSSYKAQIQDQDEQISQLTKERDEAREALGIARAIVEKIASLPIGRKASYQHQVKSFRHDLKGVYDEDFLAFLERNPES